MQAVRLVVQETWINELAVMYGRNRYFIWYTQYLYNV